jgi:hypothetical protein
MQDPNYNQWWYADNYYMPIYTAIHSSFANWAAAKAALAPANQAVNSFNPNHTADVQGGYNWISRAVAAVCPASLTDDNGYTCTGAWNWINGALPTVGQDTAYPTIDLRQFNPMWQITPR